MYKLTRRQIEFIRLMLEEEDYKSVLYFSKQLNVSDKTLKEDLKGVRAYLYSYGMEMHSKTGKGILIDRNVKRNSFILNNLHIEENNHLQEASLTKEVHQMIKQDLNDPVLL